MKLLRFPAMIATAAVLALTPIGAAIAAGEPAIDEINVDPETIGFSVVPAPLLEVERETFDLGLGQGSEITDTVVITNVSSIPLDVTLYPTDVVNDVSTGSLLIPEQSAASADVGTWITLETEAVTIAPEQSVSIPFEVVVPTQALAGDHVGAIVASIISSGDRDRGSSPIELRSAVLVYASIVGPTDTAVELEGITSTFTAASSPFAAGTVDVSFSVRNTGDVRVDARPTVVVNGPFGIPLGVAPAERITDLAPRQVVRLTYTIEDIPAAILVSTTVSLLPSESRAGRDVPETPVTEVVVESPPAETPTDGSSSGETSTGQSGGTQPGGTIAGENGESFAVPPTIGSNPETTSSPSAEATPAPSASSNAPTVDGGETPAPEPTGTSTAVPIESGGTDEEAEIVAVSETITRLAISFTSLAAVVGLALLIWVLVVLSGKLRERWYREFAAGSAVPVSMQAPRAITGSEARS